MPALQVAEGMGLESPPQLQSKTSKFCKLHLNYSFQEGYEEGELILGLKQGLGSAN